MYQLCITIGVKKMKFIHFIFISILFIFPVSLYAQVVDSPRLYLDSTPALVPVNSYVTITVFIDSQKPVNAIEIGLVYPADILKPETFNDGGTIVDLWQTRDWNKISGKINLVGGILHSYSGTGGKIAKITFKTLKEGKAQISYGPVNIYYADGKGTKSIPKLDTATIEVSLSAPKINSNITDEKTVPKFEFSKTVKNPNESNYLAVFDAKDSGSGIKMFQMRTMKWFSYGDWSEVSNPVAIPDGVWKYQISATSNSDLSTTETFYINSEILIKIGSFLAGLVFIIGVIRYIIKKCNPLVKNS
jgi:hypothetical protein